MTHQQLKLYITAQRISVDVEAMKVANLQRELEGKALAYGEEIFQYQAMQLNRLLAELTNEQ